MPTDSSGVAVGNALLLPTLPGFIGMWEDREDMADSASWVREIRNKEGGG